MSNSIRLAQVSRFLQKRFGGVAMVVICCSDSEMVRLVNARARTKHITASRQFTVRASIAFPVDTNIPVRSKTSGSGLSGRTNGETVYCSRALVINAVLPASTSENGITLCPSA